MRLMNTETLELSRVYMPAEVPDYAILSHRWYTEEITYAEICSSPISDTKSASRHKNGFAKVEGACRLARNDGFTWIWIDSCCIDKSSSVELQEAVNSMWQYYSSSNICYVYLADVADSKAAYTQRFAESEWFMRGWTLQELIAPVSVEFYAKDWQAVGTRFERHIELALITSINHEVLVRERPVHDFSVAERMSWAAHRCVTRVEDETYSLLGLFDVNMPLLYGEGRRKAFARFQETIYNYLADQSLFLYRQNDNLYSRPLLAASPSNFCDNIKCTTCDLSPQGRLPSSATYTNFKPNYTLRNQPHEQIMTSFTTSHNDVSTTLPLLCIKDAHFDLQYLGSLPAEPRVGVMTLSPSNEDATHLAILNCTISSDPNGCLCLLLRQLDIEAYARTEIAPILLPKLTRGIKSRLVKARLILVSSHTQPTTIRQTLVGFSVESTAFFVHKWHLVGFAESVSRSNVHHLRRNGHVRFSLGTEIVPSGLKRFMNLCGIVGDYQGYTDRARIVVRLSQESDSWSLQSVYEAQGLGYGNLTRLYHSSHLQDRCQVILSNRKTCVLKLRRMPGSARSNIHAQIENCYNIIIEYQ